MNWRIYYSDGTTYSEDDGPAEQSPPWGVVSVVTRGRVMQDITAVHGTGFDYYVYDGEEWWGVDFTGLLDRLAQRTVKVVCFGRTVPNAQFIEIIKQACKDKLDG